MESELSDFYRTADVTDSNVDVWLLFTMIGILLLY